MKPFLEKLAEELLSKYRKDISEICIVFPSRRAGIYFRKYLSAKLDFPIWAPAVYAIQDFIAKHSPDPVSDKLTLIFEMYEVYKQHGAYESFDRFYPWGEMLLNDFDEIDKNLVEADNLFRILREYKKVEGEFEFKAADMEEFYLFWQSFSNRELTDLQKEFINTWEIIGKVYKSFRKTLRDKNIAYEGMAYRRIYELVRSKKLNIQYIKIIFAGFNLLNKAEEGIIKELIVQGKAETYWDTDEYYMKSELQEAGHFLRGNAVKLKDDSFKWSENLLKTDKKNIKIIGAPLQISQVKALGNELKGLKQDETGGTVVVLPDESLMIPVLHSIPETIDSLNVTMGFPVKNSSLYSLIQLLKSLQKNKKGSSSSTVYYHKDAVQILLHSYIKFLSAKEIYALVNDIKKRNIIYVSRKRIMSYFNEVPGIISVIFDNIDTAEKSLDYVYKLIFLLSENLESGRNYSKFEKEYLYKSYTELNHLSDIFVKYSPQMDTETFWKLLIEVFNSIRIPFTGEPLKGMQVMGLLETRLLDFENVYILSMNEGVMPRGNSQSSFIPYNLRKAFKMPTYEDEDSTSAYYFYRLLQRAKNICLIYNTEPGELSGGEKSRFIMQVENELVKENNNIKLENLVLQTDIGIPKRKEITIQKSGEIIESLKNEKHLSATSLINYINCPLQFYFRTAARLREETSVEEFFTGAGFGTILHQIMDLLYRNYENKTVDEDDILLLKKKLNENYDDLWEEACSLIPELAEFKQELLGRNLLYKNIIKKITGKILDNDIKESPFKIIELEKIMSKEIELSADGESFKVKLLGRLDRIEEKDGILRIIDYKTGYIDKQKLKKKIESENFNIIFEDSGYKEWFQQFFYGYLYPADKPGAKIMTGIYPIKDLSGGIMFLGEENIPAEMQSLFETKLKELLTKIFDSTTPFIQTKDIKRCRFCSYKSICYRD